MANLTKRIPKSRRAKGTAIMELAVCLPLLVTLTLATVEACAMIHLKQTLKIAAFEGTRIGMIPGSAAVNVRSQCQLVLADHSVSGASISMSPSNPANLAEGSYFRVTVNAPCAPNSLIGGWFYSGRTFSESVELLYH